MITVTDQNFQELVLDSTGVFLLDIWSSWCGPCRAIAPFLEAIDADALPGVKMGKLNSDENYDLTNALEVSALPTLLFFKTGKLMAKLVGVEPESTIRKVLAEVATANSPIP